MRIRVSPESVLRFSLLGLAAAALLVPAAHRSDVYPVVEELADIMMLALVLRAGPCCGRALAVSVSALLAADTLYAVFYLSNGLHTSLFPTMVAAYMVYNLAAALFLLRAYRAAGPLKKPEAAALLLLFSGFAFLQVKYVLVPVGTGVYGSAAVWVMASVQRAAESAVLAMAVLLGMKARTRYWFCTLNGFALLPLSSFAIGYNAAVANGVPFAEYGWILGLLSVVAAQTYPSGEPEPFAKWSSIRVRLVWFVSSIAPALLLALYLLRAFAAGDAFGLTASLFFMMFGVWLVSNLIAFRVSEDIRALMDGLQTGDGPREGRGLAIYEADLFAGKLRAAYATIREQSSLAAMASISAQVAHDIRSPLAALHSSLKDLPELPEEKRRLITAAAGRINDIADDLLERNRPGGAARRSPELFMPARLVEEAVAEKRAQLAARRGLSISARLGGGAGGARVYGDPAVFSRILSNLINNSVEAMPDGGSVSAELSVSEGLAALTVSDDGKGIPPEILAELGRRGGTYGKPGGSGLGLYHARTTVEAWGGSFSISSLPGKGTAVAITLRLAPAPAAGRPAVLLDDDELVQMSWRISARKAGVALKCYREAAGLLAEAGTLPRDTPLYIDSELGDGSRGEEIAAELHGRGFSDITMATGREAAAFARFPWLKVAGKEPPWDCA